MKQLSFLTLLVLFSAPAAAYVGPGLGMGVIGTIFGVLAALVLALFGLFWYPLKRALRKRKESADAHQITATDPKQEQAVRSNAHPAQPQEPSEGSADNRVAYRSDLPCKASESATNRTDNPVQ